MVLVIANALVAPSSAGLGWVSDHADLGMKFRANGLAPHPGSPAEIAEDGRHFEFFGAEPDTWIGRLWPRGRAHQNELSTATLADNFCNGWSGA